MGGSIVRGLVKGSLFKASDITVIDICQDPLNALKAFNSDLNTALNNHAEIEKADVVILAVKPWMVEDAILDIKFKLDYKRQILVSVAAGVCFEDMKKSLNKPTEAQSLPALFRAIPNTAISVGESMTLIAANNTSSEQEALVLKIFNDVGYATLIDEDKLSAGIALTSCGIAYLFRYVRAAMLAGTEMGLYPQQAQELIVRTMKGAAALLLEKGSNPEIEIDKVTTPGGITIKGLNKMEELGFSNAIIQGLKASK